MPATLAVRHLTLGLITSFPPADTGTAEVIPSPCMSVALGEGMAPAANTVNAAENLPPWMAVLFLRKKSHVYIQIHIYVCVYSHRGI